MESLRKSLQSWNKSTPERAKLQHIYIALIIVVTLAAGLVSLLSPSLGRQIVTLAGLALIALLMNGLIWALARVYLLDFLERKQPPKKVSPNTLN